ncbi:diaminopimelate epimerase [Halorubrum sp. JWXQ-INN 858]|uniref:diaminopimelate epimerase n=1 Tax=Halorubrum sp. JWXQ-INN 858 TaxID=2690782 RepID=UPI0013FCE3D2|nr:diaminopimelate epimerase [Halorubrum sp. JWXQ-INN 858]MWV65782.1 diaminopimelate epimerase [Halorubrum sp. JWXQ-INN 858]
MSTHAVPVEKYHGTGNDFVVVDAAETVGDRAAFARAYCDRETGVDAATCGADAENGLEDGPGSDPGDGAGRRGADGVLFLSIEDRYRPTRVVMTLVQPDGSTAAMCGNGARVVARWAHDRTGEREFMIDTQAGTRRASVTEDGSEATIEMGTPRFAPADVPVDHDGPFVEQSVAGLTVTAVDTGVPHAVAFVDDVDAVDLAAVAPPVRNADVFPAGANVNLAAIVDDGAGGEGPPVIDQRTFERGVEGETRSCGTGAVAIAAVARRLGLVDGETVRTRPPGGELSITVPAGGPATLTGPVTHEFTGSLPADPL